MKHINATQSRRFFQPLLCTRSLQAATMVLPPGRSSSDQVENEHPRAEQWLFVVSGSGCVRTPGRVLKVKAGSLVLIEKAEPHQVANTGRRPLVTLNFYAPPAYTPEGEVRPAVQRHGR